MANRGVPVEAVPSGEKHVLDGALQMPDAEAMRILFDASSRAQQAHKSIEEFAVELSELDRASVAHTALRSLLCCGYVKHLVEESRARSHARNFHPPASPMRFDQDSCFVLTAAGVRFARAHLHRFGQASSRIEADLELGTLSAEVSAHSRVPQWNAGTRELWFRGALVKAFRARAPNQELILAAFEEERWPPHIDDPLPPLPSQETRRRLNDAISKLNRHQQSHLIRFRADGAGAGICWHRVG
jgi:hypothetical protein